MRNITLIMISFVALAACSDGEADAGSNASAMPPKPVQLRRRDFDWSKVPEARQYRQKIVAAANSALRSDPACVSLDPATLSREAGSGSGSKPVFQLQCRDRQGQPHSVAVNIADLDEKARLSTRSPLDQAEAMLLCRKAVKQATAHPYTVKFEWGDIFDDLGEAKAHFATTFSAENSFGVRDGFRAHCFFTGERLTRLTTSPAIS
ncbi:hypothetical protein ACU5AX_02930 [Sphingomonas sp. XXL09]|uniref:hypothetical protein n=1 Tax=Sphingomonas sp. XXL09 TaxID=3457787 RepID=UPI00406BB76E